MAVVLHHLTPHLVPGGYVGVDVFFVISGYLITKIIHAEILAGTFTFADFYERRVRRIVPALLAVITVVLTIGWFAYLPSDYLATTRAAISTVLFVANIEFWRVLQDGYFAADAKLNPLLHMWSLGVEEQFYIGFPILLLFCMRHAKRWLIPILASAALTSFVLAAVLVGAKPVAVFFLSPARGWELLTGCIVAVAALPQPAHAEVRKTLAWLALIGIVSPAFFYTTKTVFPGIAAIPPVLGTALLIHLGAQEPTRVSRLLSMRPVVFLGLLSYSLYLWHWPVVVFAKYFLQVSELGAWAPLLLGLSMVLAWLSYKYIEKPCRKRAGRRGNTGLIVFAIPIVLAIIVVGILGMRTRGFENRWPAQSIMVDRERTKPVPFIECDSRIGDASRTLCVIGDPSAQPDALLWGDSHMLAWLPGLDSAFRDRRRSALVAPNSACPPLLGVRSTFKHTCKNQNDVILTVLQKHPDIHQVVMAAFWQSDFSDNSFELFADDGRTGNAAVAPEALRNTLKELPNHVKEILVLGPVPTYAHDVPLAVARELAGTPRPPDMHLTLLSVRQLNALFYATIEQGRAPGIRFIDVAEWICPGGPCTVYDGGVLYRDSNHLSDYGSEYFAGNLKEVIDYSSSPPDALSPGRFR